MLKIFSANTKSKIDVFNQISSGEVRISCSSITSSTTIRGKASFWTDVRQFRLFSDDGSNVKSIDLNYFVPSSVTQGTLLCFLLLKGVAKFNCRTDRYGDTLHASQVQDVEHKPEQLWASE